MTYRDSLKHLIAEQQRQRLNAQLIQQALRDHANQMNTINDQLVHRLKLELNKINVNRMVQFLKNL